MYRVQLTVSSVQWAVYSVQWPVYSVRVKLLIFNYAALCDNFGQQDHNNDSVNFQTSFIFSQQGKLFM